MHPTHCRCGPASRFTVMYPPPMGEPQSHYRFHTGYTPFPTPTTPLAGAYPHSHSAPPFVNSTGPLPTQLQSPSPSFGANRSSLPFPVALGDVTASVVNAALPAQQNPRKRTNALSNTRPPAKRRIIPRASSNATTPPVPVTSTEAVCGVGPAASASAATTSALPQPTSTAELSTQLSGHQYAKKLARRSTDKKTATDVWFFLEPLTNDATDVGMPPLPEGTDFRTFKPLIMKKPDEKVYPRLKCRLCP